MKVNVYSHGADLAVIVNKQEDTINVHIWPGDREHELTAAGDFPEMLTGNAKSVFTFNYSRALETEEIIKNISEALRQELKRGPLL